MQDKKIKIVIFVFLLLILGIHTSLALFKRSANVSTPLTAASWNVSVSSNSSSIMQLIPDSGSISYNITVTSSSEVDTDYSIIVSNIPSGVQVKLDAGNFEPYSSTVTFPNVGTILYGAQPNSVAHTLTFRANAGAAFVNN